MTQPYYADTSVTVHHGDCLDVLRALPDNSVDSIVTDPPYGLGFMGKAWDELPPGEDWARECLRVLKPGGHLLAFGGTRTWHRLACAVEDAGFEVRDSIAWLYGSGFPKSLDVSKAIDKANGRQFEDRFALGRHIRERREALGHTRTEVNGWLGAATKAEHYESDSPGFARVPTLADWNVLRDRLGLSDEHAALVERVEAEREVIGAAKGVGARDPHSFGNGHLTEYDVTAPATDDARTWQGWGTALKPGHEPVVCARKPVQDSDFHAKIGSYLLALETACRLDVSNAARSSAPTQADSPEATTASAPANAATPHEAEPARLTPTGAAAGSSAATDTSASESTAGTFSSTVTSWRASWAEICEATSTSTTSTGTSRTTDLPTLSSCLSSITRSVTGQSTLDPDSWRSLVTAADNLFAAGVLNSRSTLALSAIESATAGTQPDFQGAAEGNAAAFEPVVVARKPLVGTVATNVTTHGTGALNIDACRIGTDWETDPTRRGWQGRNLSHDGGEVRFVDHDKAQSQPHTGGRWPANVVLDDTQAAALDEQSGTLTSGANPTRRGPGKSREAYGDFKGQAECTPARGVDKGGASRFFYVAKAPKSERPVVDGTAHPTVKPLTLMRWLVRLVTPPGGTVLEPFAGSGTTVEACLLEGFRCIAIEKTPEYLPLILARIERANTTRLADEVTRTPDPETAILEQLGDALFDIEETA